MGFIERLCAQVSADLLVESALSSVIGPCALAHSLSLTGETVSPVTEQELDQALSPLTTTATLLHEAQLHCAAAMARRLPRNTRADAVNTNALASVCRGAL